MTTANAQNVFEPEGRKPVQPCISVPVPKTITRVRLLRAPTAIRQISPPLSNLERLIGMSDPVALLRDGPRSGRT